MTHSLLALRSAAAIGSLAILASGFLFAAHPVAAPGFSSAVAHSLAMMIPGGR